MQWRNSSRNYGLTSILLHWGVALTVVGLFALGLWMRGLNYYSQWYRTAPDIHKSVGLILLAVMVLRLVWRWLSPPPAALPTHTPLVRLASTAGHLTLYAGLFDGEESAALPLAPGRLAYVHVVQGRVGVNGKSLQAGDALKLEGEFQVLLDKGEAAEVLVFDLPPLG